jgi:hypothetical protein
MSGASSLSYIGASDRKMDAQFLSMRLHIGYIRSLDDSQRVRAACICLLQRWLSQFYPHRPDIVGEAKHLASELGGRLENPRFPWKYAWINRCFGWRTAKQAQVFLPTLKMTLLRSWDKAMLRFDPDESTKKRVSKPT